MARQVKREILGDAHDEHVREFKMLRAYVDKLAERDPQSIARVSQKAVKRRVVDRADTESI